MFYCPINIRGQRHTAKVVVVDEVFNAVNATRLADDLVAWGLYPVNFIWSNYI